ncbi:MAG: ornithine carbamoyltransferase [Nitrospirae bacterium RBG_16_64_22]|nr:MAG: ornithine carbamoyltransferase [Nitrospirae bacterium RBG_16_64_22]
MLTDLLSLGETAPADISRILTLAAALKRDMKRRRTSRPLAGPLAGKTLVMIFEKSSTRTRLSFEVGMYQLGGQAIFLSPRDIQLGRGETIEDTARVLSRYAHAIMIRTFAHETVESAARAADVPVINGLSDKHHPCQVLADLMTLKAKKGRLKGLMLAYVGDGNNMAHSLLEGCAKTGVSIAVATPKGYEPDEAVVAGARKAARGTGASVLLTCDPALAVRGAHAVYTDVWTSMGQEDEAARRRRAFAGYQVNAALLASARPDAVVMHCLPAHRGEEITADVLDGPRSVVLDQAENRLHAQKAVLLLLMGRPSEKKTRRKR